MANLTEMNSEEDRLSLLPNTILFRILSHLPINYSAKTSILSRRWRNLWKGVTTFKFQTLGIKFEIVRSILHHLISPNIRVFDYSFRQIVYRLGQYRVAESCFLHLISRQIEVIKLNSTSYLPVPNCLFNCESLVVLDLDGQFHWMLKLDEDNDLPVNGATIHLPNLKMLRLRLNDCDYCLLRTLLKFCPVLEELCLLLDLSHDELILEIVAPNLKSLTIEMLVPAFCSDVVIDTPKLSKLKIRDPCSYYTFETIPTSLVEASIKLKRIKGTYWFPGADESIDWTIEGHALALSEIVRDISSVRYLQVECYANMHTFFGAQYYGDMAVFPDLTFFRTTIDSLVGWDDLLRSLHCFPNLEHLELKIGDFYSLWPSDWCAPIVLPDCLLTKVKRITVKKAKRISHEIKLLEFILNYADVLEELSIYGPSPGLRMEYGVHQFELLWREYNFCQALFKLPRSSVTCEIVLSGFCISASSNAFENELIGCQIDFQKLSDSDSD